MKKSIIYILVLSLFLLTACSEKAMPSESPVEEKGFPEVEDVSPEFQKKLSIALDYHRGLLAKGESFAPQFNYEENIDKLHGLIETKKEEEIFNQLLNALAFLDEYAKNKNRYSESEIEELESIEMENVSNPVLCEYLLNNYIGEVLGEEYSVREGDGDYVVLVEKK